MSGGDDIVPEAVLEAFGCAGATLTRFERGLINRHWLVEHADERVVLRRYNPARSAPAIEWEAALVRFAASHGWPVAPPLPTVYGGDLFAFAGRYWALAPFLPGEPNEEPGLETFHVLGERLAHLHADLRDFDLPGQRPSFGRAIDFDMWLDPSGTRSFDAVLRAFSGAHPELAQRIRAARATVEADLARCGYDDLEPLPVHGDFQRFNILWDRGELSGLLDFDFARRDALVCDLATMLVPYLPLEPRAAGSLLAGYESVRRLTDTERNVMAALPRALLLCWVALLLAGWESGANPTAVASITNTMTMRFPALDAAEAEWRALLR